MSGAGIRAAQLLYVPEGFDIMVGVMVHGVFGLPPRPHPHLNVGSSRTGWSTRPSAEGPEEKVGRLDVRLVRPGSVAGHRCARPASFAVARNYL